MSIIGPYIKAHMAYAIGSVSGPLLAIASWAVLSVLEVFVLSTYFISLAPWDIHWGYDLLLVFLFSCVGSIQSNYAINVPRSLLSLENNILFNAVIIISLACGVIPSMAYMKFPLPWNFIVAFIFFAVIKVATWFVLYLLVGKHLNKFKDGEKTDPSKTSMLRAYSGNGSTDMVFRRTSDITWLFLMFGIGLLIMNVFQFLQYIPLGPYPYNELWVQMFVLIPLVLFVVILIIFTPYPNGDSLWSRFTGRAKACAAPAKRNDTMNSFNGGAFNGEGNV